MAQSKQNGAPPRADPNEAMITAAKAGDIDGLRRALAAGADPMGATRMSRTALMVAASEGRAECVELLLPWSDAEAKSHWGGTALMRAAEHGHIECVRILMRAAGVDATDEEGKTALMLAAFAGHAECVQSLLASANPKATNDAGDDALMCAAAGRQARCVRALMAVCDAKAKNKKGRTALMIAVEHWQPGSSIVDLLLGASDLMARDNEGRSAPDFVPHPGDPLSEPLRERLRRLAAEQEAAQLREGLGAEEKGANAARRAPKTL
jgi:ankyrin repeat protein